MMPSDQPIGNRGHEHMDLTGREAGRETALPPRITVIYEDNHLIAAIKPAGVLSQADGSGKPDMLGLLKQDIKARYGKPGQVYLGLVHRLDQPVSGVMVFARTSKAAARLSAQIREHRVAKYYLAVVHGCPTQLAGKLHDRLSKNPATGQVRLVDGDVGQDAWLDYRVVESLVDPRHGQPLALLAIRLGSGRGHQIRVQLASRGWAIVGDHRYGRPAGTLEPANPALFACLYSLDHPVSGQRLHVHADPPEQSPWSLFQPVKADSLAAFFDQTTDPD